MTPLSEHLRYWGKAQPAQAAASTYHPLVCHCLDVAAVGQQFLHRQPLLTRRMAQRLAISEQQLVRWLCFWLTLHDLGKFSEAFQSQREDLFESLRRRRPDPSKPYTMRHDSLGMWIWTDVVCSAVIEQGWLGDFSADHRDGLACWARAVTGHHGQPPIEGGSWKQHFHVSDDRTAVTSFTVDMCRLLLGGEFEPLRGFDPDEFHAASLELSWTVAGIAVLADWLGSNTTFFPYLDLSAQPLDLAAYWHEAQQHAKRALDASGLLTRPRAVARPLAELFPVIQAPSPLQAWASECPLQPGPQIHLLEDVTGAGKTEAAVMLAHRLMAGGMADGFFIGLPTMATANAMYGRVTQVYAKLFDGDASLVLANGQRHLVEAFAASVLPRDAPEHDRAQADESASARCAAWLADHSKRALLAPAGVGTIDQALLAVLQSKHQSLRLLGLTRKVLVVDEVHACDDYMLGVLKTLLAFHARAGGSAILLSATLPQQMKQALLNAFASGCAAGSAGDLPAHHKLIVQAQAYPLATSWSGLLAQALHETPITSRPEVCRTVQVNAVTTEDEATTVVLQALASGQCVCWMRNTVADALAAHRRFRALVPPERLMLFHARFTLRDRLDMEDAVLACFGSRSGPGERQGRLLIATQVVEQSLDVDFDVVVTDLAPIDRVIQRAGRLRRHVRDESGQRLPPGQADRRGTPTLWLLQPPWADSPAATWFKQTFPKSSKVYANHAQLWLTAQALRPGQFSMPADARRLIEAVFGESDIPEGLRANANAADGQGYADASQARANTIRPALGYERGGIDWWGDAKTPTRLGEASTTVLLARWDGERLRPWAEGQHAWAYSSLRVAERLIAEAAPPADARLAAAIESLTPELPAQGRWSVLLVLTPQAGGWAGAALSQADKPGQRRQRRWLYDHQRGLQEDTPRNDAT